jgi:mono/diheme cytochrome c family protein
MSHWTLLIALTTSLAIAAQPTKRPSDEERGETLYNRHCIQCHGPLAEGDGPATKALVKPVPNVKGKVRTDELMIRILLRGQGFMPGFDGSFDKYDARRVLRYMSALGKPKAEALEAKPSDEEEEELPVDDVGNAPPAEPDEAAPAPGEEPPANPEEAAPAPAAP